MLKTPCPLDSKNDFPLRFSPFRTEPHLQSAHGRVANPPYLQIMVIKLLDYKISSSLLFLLFKLQNLEAVAGLPNS